MAVIYKNGQFHLRTKNTSYIFSVYQNKYLVHHYWGDRLDTNIDLRHRAEDTGIDRPNGMHVQLEKNAYIFLTDLPLEFSNAGKGDDRIPVFQGKDEEGCTVFEFTFDGYETFQGKESLQGLPSVAAKEQDGAESLFVTMKDEKSGLKAVIKYTVSEAYDSITRSICYCNEGTEKLHLLSAQSMGIDFEPGDWQMMDFPGDWARERNVECRDVTHGIFTVDSKRGYSGHMNNPFVIIKERNTDEDFGRTYGFSLLYSGNFSFDVEKAQVGSVRITGGISPFQFDWELQPQEQFQSPEMVLVYSGRGLNGMSGILHKLYRERLFKRSYARPIVINNWEGTGFDFDEEKILDIAETGAQVGAELFVLDDGWFGRRNDDQTSLGDWFCNMEKLPHGLNGLAEKILQLGLRFGLWVEPEMVSPDSRLYRLHPDWCIHAAGRERTLNRNQLVLDFSRKEVREYILNCMRDLLASAPISYIKWDCNRGLAETAGQMQAHRHILGLYEVLETLTEEYPDVLFEGCASGGGRFDAGMLAYMPQTWTSDNARPFSRLYIQHGTSYGYPPVSMTAHIGRMETGLDRWNSYMHFYAMVAMAGNFGLEMDLSLLSDREKEQIKGYVTQYKAIRETIQNGDFYRLESPFESTDTTWQFVSADQKETIVFCYQTAMGLNRPQHLVKLKGLDKDGIYLCEGKQYGGEELMKCGMYVEASGEDYHARCYVWERKEKVS